MGRNRIETILDSAEATQAFARQFAKSLSSNDLIALHGDLGAGKTTFIQGLVQGFGEDASMVQSPTFVYLHLYPTSIPIYHFDLYRISSPNDFLAMGFDEYFEKDGITAIEWPERIASILPAHAIHIHFHPLSENTRKLVIE